MEGVEAEPGCAELGQTPAGARAGDAYNPAHSDPAHSGATASLWLFPNKPELSSRTRLALCQVPVSPASESHCLPVTELTWAVSPSPPRRDGCGHCRRLSGATACAKVWPHQTSHKRAWQSGLRWLSIHPHPIGRCEKHHLHFHWPQV